MNPNKASILEGTDLEKKIYRFVFSPPPSGNRLHAKGLGRLTFKPSSQRWRFYAQLVARKQGAPYPPLSGELIVTYRIYGVNQDFDNTLKVLNDSMNGVIWQDDSQIVDARILVDREAIPPRVEIVVKPKTKKIKHEDRAFSMVIGGETYNITVTGHDIRSALINQGRALDSNVDKLYTKILGTKVAKIIAMNRETSNGKNQDE